MVKGSKGRILQIRLFSTIPNPQTNRLEHYNVYWKSFSWIPDLPNFCSGGLMVDGTGNCKDNKEGKTRKVADIRMHHIIWIFLAKMWYAVAMLVDMRAVYTFNMSDHTKYMWVGVRRHRGRHGQLGGEDQGGHWHEDVTHQLKFSRTWFAIVMVVDMKVV